MIQFSTSHSQSPSPSIKGVGMISGGLDSTLAAKVVKDLGVDVHGIYFAMPWGCCDKGAATSAAEKIGIKLIVLQLDERYLEMVRKPQHGYGSAMNPCIDCRIHMFGRAAQYMKHIGAEFVFTGEVLGQRPMSQRRNSMKWIEQDSGLEGRLLRPLSAQFLDPTIPEIEGKIDRTKLLRISGRSRKEQIQLAEQFSIDDYPAPAGGCSLTDPNFARRMKDLLEHGYRNFRETVALKWGKHFRFNPQTKVIIGRDEHENNSLIHFAHRDDWIVQFAEDPGPTALYKGPFQLELIQQTGGLIQRFSRLNGSTPRSIRYWPASSPNDIKTTMPTFLEENIVEKMYI